MNKVTTGLAAITWAASVGAAAAAPPGLPIDPVAHRPSTGGVGIGYYAADAERVEYRGLLEARHSIERESAGVLLTGSWGHVPSEPTDPPPGDGGGSGSRSRSTGEPARDATWTTLWMQIPTDATASLDGSTALDGRPLDGGGLSVGAAATVGGPRGGAYAFIAGTLVDESVRFVADGREASGTLSGSETALGAGVSRTFADRLTLSTGFRQTFSALEFERTVQVGTPDFPESRTVTDEVERRERTAWLAGASLRLLDAVFLDVRASYRDEAAVSLAISVGL